MARPRFMPRPLLTSTTEPFRCAEEAWLWYAHCQMARLAGCRPRADMADIPRPCDPDDIHREAMRLFRSGRLSQGHLRVLAELATRLVSDGGTTPWSEGQDSLWREALDKLEISLRNKGIVA